MIDNRLPTELRALLGVDPAALSEVVAAAWRALTGWPDTVADIAASRVALRTGRHNDGNEGRTMRFLSRRHQFGASGPVADLIAEWRRTISVHLHEGAALRDRTASGTDVANVTGLESRKVLEYRRSGVFKIHFALDLERPEARFNRAELMGIGAALGDRISYEGARKVLGMSCHGVEQLAAMRLLDIIEHPYFDAHYGGSQVSKGSLDSLVAAMRSAAAPPDGDTISLRNVMKTIGGRMKPWGEAFRILLAGELRFALAPGDLPLTEAILIDPAALPFVRSLVLTERILLAMSPFMSKTDAGEMLNLGPARTTDLLANIETGVGSHRKSVPLEIVHRLARRHMSATEIAARRDVTALRAHLDAIAAMVPHLGAGGFCRATAEATFFGG